MRYLFFILLPVLLFSQKYDPQKIEHGKRGNEYRVWIYFTDKDGSEPVTVSPKAIERRNKNDISTNHLWYDLQVSPIYKNVIASLGLTIKNESRWLNAISVICSKADLDRISELPFVDKIEPVLMQKKSLIQNSDIVELSRTLDYGGSQVQMEQINCIAAHDLGYFGQGIRILYLDTGFELNHEVFDSLNVVAQYDFINNDENTANENDQEIEDGQDHHGTLCLSVLAGYEPGYLIGPAFKSEYLLAKTEIVADEIEQEEDNYVAGLEWGEQNGADIACSSLGYLDWYTYENLDGNTAVTTIGVDIAASLGVLTVTSAGNEGNDDWYYIITPADADSVLSVGAVNSSGDIAYFSSHGPTYDGRIKPEVCAMGLYTYCISPNTTSEYSSASGTSLSAPLAAGAAAVVLSANLNLSAMELREALMMTASMADSPNNDYGWGIVNTLAAINYEFMGTEKDQTEFIPIEYHVLKTYPNPFNPSLIIQVSAPPGVVLNVDVFSYDGRFIANLYSGKQFATVQTLNWKPGNVPSGIYFIRSSVNGKEQFKKVTFIK
jgi:subtilisin family serine protease